jgi:SAM-dependent methyltransferase
MDAATPSPPACSPIQTAVLRRVQALKLPAGAKMLDAPCGAGALSLALNQLGYECWGTDVSPEAEPSLAGRFRRADLNQPLPWPDASFSLFLSVEGIEHLENVFSFLREAHRVLVPGGKLLLTTPNIASLRSRVRFLGSGFFGRDPRPLNETRPNPLHHINLRTFPELRYALHTSGFRLLEVGDARRKPVSYLYAPYVPWMWLYTLIAFRKEKDAGQRRRNREIRKTLFSPSLLFSENLMLLAEQV